MAEILATGGEIADARHGPMRYKTETVTLAADKVLTNKSPPVQFLDNGAAVRNVDLPAEADSEGLFFFIKNIAGGAFAITVRDDAAVTQASIAQLESCICFCDGTTWECMVGAET